MKSKPIGVVQIESATAVRDQRLDEQRLACAFAHLSQVKTGTSWDIFFKTLQLFWVRYYIADRGGATIADQAGYPAITLPRRPLFGKPGLWRIYELPRPNVGNYSPTAVVTAASAPEIVAAMRAANFDFTRQVVLSVTPREPVVPAQDVQLSPIPGGLSPVGAQQGYIAPRLAAAIFELFARPR